MAESSMDGIDLYADVDDFGRDQTETFHDNDLYDDVITSRNDSGDEQKSRPVTIQANTAVTTPNLTGRRFSLYVGNLTWWTTDQDLQDAITSIGVTDLINVKFHENRTNGQSKGFATVTVGSDSSSRLVLERLAQKDLHGMLPSVSYCTAAALQRLDPAAATKKESTPSNSAPGTQSRSGSTQPQQRAPTGTPQQPSPMQFTPQPQSSPLGNRLQGPPPQGIALGPPPPVGPLQSNGGPPPRLVFPGSSVQQMRPPMSFAQLPPPNIISMAPPRDGSVTIMSVPPPGSRPPMMPPSPGNVIIVDPRLPPPPRGWTRPPDMFSQPPPSGPAIVFTGPPPPLSMPPPSGLRSMPDRFAVSTAATSFDRQMRPTIDAGGNMHFAMSPLSFNHRSAGGIVVSGPPGQLHMIPGGIPPPGLPPPNQGHINPAFLPPPPVSGVLPPAGTPIYPQDPYGRPPPSTAYPPPMDSVDRHRPPPGMDRPVPEQYIRRQSPERRREPPPMQLSDVEFDEILQRNKTVSSSAISRAVQDASSGDYGSAIETLVTAVSLIKQSKIANDDRCKILISSLQDTLHGIELKSYGSKSTSSRDRARSRSPRDRDLERSRSSRRSRSREYHDELSRERYRELAPSSRERSRSPVVRERSREHDLYERSSGRTELSRAVDSRRYESERGSRSTTERDYATSSSRSSRH